MKEDIVCYRFYCLKIGVSLDSLWKCFSNDDFFDIYVNYIVKFIDEDFYDESLKIEVAEVLNTITEREIVKMFFAIDCKEMDLKKISERLYLSRERVRQLKERSILKLKGQRSYRLMQFLG